MKLKKLSKEAIEDWLLLAVSLVILTSPLWAEFVVYN